jgi:hypothetical protein
MDDLFHIFIASCYEGLDIQVPRLIKNVLEANIPPNFVHFIVGGCPTNKIYSQNGIEIVNVTYRCFEFTPIIYIAHNENKYNFDYAFFTHDTVKFGKNFYKTILNDISYVRMNHFDTMRIENSLPSMNIGIYSKKIILENKQQLFDLSINTNDKTELIKLKHLLCKYEDFILNQNNYNNGDKSENTRQKFTGLNGVISNGLLRYFNRIDLIKYQSNAYDIQSIDICKID